MLVQRVLVRHVERVFRCSDELVEHVVVSLSNGLEGDPGLFEKVVLDDAAADHPLGVERDLHEFSEPGRVVVSDCFGVAWNTSIISELL